MSVANPLWGAPRIHGELLKLGIDVGQTSVAKYMERRRVPPSTEQFESELEQRVEEICAQLRAGAYRDQRSGGPAG
jgi:hypothetical protein